MYVGFTKLILFAIGAAQTPTAIASSSSSSSSSSGSGTSATDLINSAADASSSSSANGNINIIGNRLLQDEDTCVCSPRTYTFKFNFSGTCPGNISNAGVEDQICFITPEEDDLTPVVITAVTVSELDKDANILREQDYDGPFSDGNTIQYTSISDSLDPNVSLDDQLTNVPKAIEVVIVGRNQAGEGGIFIFNFFRVDYTLNCEVEPIASGDQIGWTEISGYEPAIPAFCSAVTYAPTVTPSEAPTESPTTAAPTVTPSEAPTESPTTTTTPSEAPTESPTTAAPTVTPSEAPTESPTTSAPTVTPSEAPTESPTTAAPTITSLPSEAPIESPIFNSMSYHSASFSVSHAKTAKAKAVKAKGGKISKRT